MARHATLRGVKDIWHFEKAEALIAETGYHRRDVELEALRQTL